MMKRLFIGLMLIVPLSAADAQRIRGGNGGFGSNEYVGPGEEYNVPYDGRFTFARIRYRGTFRTQPEHGFFTAGWGHDYPAMETNFLNVLQEITLVSMRKDESNIFSLDDPEVFKYPVLYLSEPGGWFPGEVEMANVTAYLSKGGFIIMDDLNSEDMPNTVMQLRRVLPTAELVELDDSHPVFDSFYRVTTGALNMGNMGGGSGFGRGGPRVGTWYGIHQDNDPKKRLMVVIGANYDFGNLLEVSGRGRNPVNLESEAYKLAVNYIIYALTR
jgi:hypothetical protein